VAKKTTCDEDQRLINNRQNGRRRGRGSGPRPAGNVPNQPNRQDNRSRGNAAQLHEKYKALARDAQLAGDRVQTEYFLQFADHYYRVLNESRARFEEQRRQRDDYEDDEDQDGDMNAADGYDDREAADERPEPRRQYSEQREDRGGRDRSEREPRNGRDRNDREPRGGREPVENEPRVVREQAPEREPEGDREPRGERRPRRERLVRPRSPEPQEDEGQARISLDVLPPAIAADIVEVAPKPRRRTRRPDPEADVDIAPAA
jgi:hypothetical protein